jgi:hypothetical protein
MTIGIPEDYTTHSGHNMHIRAVILGNKFRKDRDSVRLAVARPSRMEL